LLGTKGREEGGDGDDAMLCTEAFFVQAHMDVPLIGLQEARRRDCRSGCRWSRQHRIVRSSRRRRGSSSSSRAFFLAVAKDTHRERLGLALLENPVHGMWEGCGGVFGHVDREHTATAAQRE